MRNVCIVLPTYNEADNIVTALDAIFTKAKSSAYSLRVLVVDDKSPDGTADIAKQHAQVNDYDVRIVSGNKAGLGKAYLRGFDFVRKHNLGDTVVMMDADLSHDAAEIPGFIEQLSEADLVIGSRYVIGGMIPGEWPVLRVVNSRVARFVSRYIGGLSTSVSDPAAGFRSFELDILDKHSILETGKTSGYVFMVGMTNGFDKSGLTISELPIKFRDRTHGESKIGISDIIEYFVYCYGMGDETPFKKTTVSAMEWAVVGLLYLITQNIVRGANIGSMLGLFISAQVAIIALLALKHKKFEWLSQLKYASGRAMRVRRAIKELLYFDVSLTASVLVLSYMLSSGYVIEFSRVVALYSLMAVAILAYQRLHRMVFNV